MYEQSQTAPGLGCEGLGPEKACSEPPCATALSRMDKETARLGEIYDMSNEKLAEALRSLRLKFTSGNDVPVPEARITRAEWEALEQAHAAEAAQPQAQNSEWVMVPREPTQAMLDANGDCDFSEGKAWLEKDARTTWAAMLAAVPQPQAAEPVAYGLFTKSGLIRMWSKKWFGECDGKSCQPVPLYTHPQPAQDAKDAARYRWLKQNDNLHLLAEDVIDEAIAAMAKESGR